MLALASQAAVTLLASVPGPVGEQNMAHSFFCILKDRLQVKEGAMHFTIWHDSRCVLSALCCKRYQANSMTTLQSTSSCSRCEGPPLRLGLNEYQPIALHNNNIGFVWPAMIPLQECF